MLGPSERVELLEGVIHDMSPIGPLHGGITKRLARFFTLSAEARWIVSVQDPLALDTFSEPEPDIMLLKPAPDDYIKHHPTADDVFLLIEVSDSSLTYDRTSKLPAYARAAVCEVWLVNLSAQSIEIYREPDSKGYRFTAILRKGDIASPQAFPQVSVQLSEIFRLEA